MIKLLIYDLDGTLIDSRADIANSVNWALQELGFKALPKEQVSSFVGSGVRRLMEQVLEKAAPPGNDALERAITLYRKRYAEHLLDETKLYLSVPEVLEHFKARKQAVITNKPEGFSKEILKGLGVDSYFFRLIGGDQEFPKKPDPAPVLEVISHARVRPEETVFIGDSDIDIETGKNAKIQTIAVTYGFGALSEIKHAKPDFIFHDLRELLTCPIF